MKPYFLGVDTSNYTTSLAIVDENVKLVNEVRQVLTVPHSQKGLRQSEALFQHVQNLPDLTKRLFATVERSQWQLAGIAASVSPRPIEDSYLPVFLSGTSLAKSLAASWQIPYYELSHQENHMWAGIYSARGPSGTEILALHLSGGTSELVKAQQIAGFRWHTQILGQSIDLHAGQFVDRVGVALGLQFPTGAQLDSLAANSQKKLIIPSYHKRGKLSFAGPHSAALRMIDQEKPADIAAAVFDCIARSIEKLIRYGQELTGINQVLVVGGVAASNRIRQQLTTRLVDIELFFAEPQYSTDNALGAGIFAALNGLNKFDGNLFP